MSDIQRFQQNQRMSQMVIHGDTIYLAGQVAEGDSVAAQTQACLDQIDALLAEGGSDKSRILSAQIWLADISDFAEMNGVWDAWVSPGNAPARAAGTSDLALPQFKVEIIVTAAK